MSESAKSPRRINFIANCVYGRHVAGGDIHFFNMARAAMESGWQVRFFGGHALQQVLLQQDIPAPVTLTDDAVLADINPGGLTGQLALFRDYLRRYRRTLRLLDQISADDLVYAVSDAWFDAVPAARSAARCKLMVWHMTAPSLGQILRRSRPDVDAKRLASLHYHFGQHWSLSAFRSCPNKRVLYVHPNMRPYLLVKQFREDELRYLSAGFDPSTAERIAQPAKEFDVAWIGRVHRQKGIDDLIATLRFLSGQFPDFKAILIGPVEEQLRPLLVEAKLDPFVKFSGFVSEAEKFRLLKASRIFLMPSRHESWGSAIAEAVVANLRVVAYELEAYRPVFANLLCYVQPFDLEKFQTAALEELTRTRAGAWQPDAAALSTFKEKHRWETISASFVRVLNSMTDA
jgi:glycosyltransferase involved in cell wall biosynthesis